MDWMQRRSWERFRNILGRKRRENGENDRGRRHPRMLPGDGTCRQIVAGRKQPLPEHGCIGLDTGCVWKKKLTAMVIEENKNGLEYQIRQVEYGK